AAVGGPLEFAAPLDDGPVFEGRRATASRIGSESAKISITPPSRLPAASLNQRIIPRTSYGDEVAPKRSAIP
ncbi:hypothetical protein, partial [Methylobacterium sp. Leaf466]|uniref:hypothetical protein n=1 Tax=Methylobacterium sp. Leaf466 TaxID=1736386 RepID=UPI001AEC5F0B